MTKLATEKFEVRGEQRGRASLNFDSLAFRQELLTPEMPFDDIVVICGLVLAGRVDPEVARACLNTSGSALRGALGEIVTSGRVPSEDWDLFQRLWHRWKIPLGAAPLSWWHLYCVALGRIADVRAATDLFQDWLEKIEAAEPNRRLAVHGELTGIGAERGAVLIRDDIASLPHFVLAALDRLPLLSLSSEEDLPTFEAASPSGIVTDLRGWGELPEDDLPLRAEPVRTVANLRMLCLGRRPQIGALGEDVRRFWAELSQEDRTYVLVHLEQRIAALEIVRLSYGNVVLDNEAIAAVLNTCRRDDPADWNRLQIAISTIIWAYQEAGFVLQELNRSEVNLIWFRIFIERRVGEFARAAGRHVASGLRMMDLVRELAALRPVVERTHQRCLYFDGGSWERREFLVPRQAWEREHALPPALKSFMQERFGIPLPEAPPDEAWRLYLRALVERSHTPSELMIALADWAADAQDLPVDYATFDVPLGIHLDRPWELGIDDIFCYTAFRSGFEVERAGVPLKRVGVQNAIGQRMRYNAVKKAQNYALIKSMTPQVFLLPDISVAEDAHHGGHFASGLRHTCRIPISIHHCGSAWKGIADVRLNRAQYDKAFRFTEEQIVVASRYGAWATAVAAEAYALELQFDPRYCGNLEDGRNLEAKLGKRA